MNSEIPMVIKLLYSGSVTGPDPRLWPDEMKNDPVAGHGLWAFYSGLRMGLQLGTACLEQD